MLTYRMPRGLQNPRIFGPLVVGLVLITYLFYYNSVEDKVFKLDVPDSEIPLTGGPSLGIKKPLILIYTKVFGDDPIAKDYLGGCPLKCQLTADKRLFTDAHAVVFHGGDFKAHDLPKKRANPTQKWVFWSMETKEAGYLKQSQDGIDALKPDWIMDYSTAAHIPHYYGGFYVDPQTAQGKGYQPVANLTTEEILKDKQFRGAIGFISNCGSKERLKAAKAMSKYMRVDIGGKCALDSSKKELCPRNTDCTPIINWNYFYLALENMNCVDYVSEKFTERLHLPVIPVVVSKRNYEHRFPKEAYIAMDDYKSAKELTDYLNHLMKHPSEYVKLFEWRKHWARAPWNGDGYRNGVCALCEKLMEEGNKPTEAIPNINKWRQDHAPCVDKVLPDSWFQ